MRLPVKKCLVVFDTNLIYLYKEDRQHNFLPKDSFLEFCGWVNSNKIKDICLFCIPEIVVCEIAKQKFDENTIRYSKYLEFGRFFDQQNTLIQKTFGDCLNEIKEYFSSKDIFLLPHPTDFDGIINRAVHKKKPFNYSKESGDDKGFKDALLVHSVLEIDNTSEFEQVFICTKNKNDFTQEIESEMDNLRIFRSENALIELKNEIIKNYSWRTKLIGFLDENKAEILSYINDIDAYNYSGFVYNPDDFKFDIENNVVEFAITAGADDMNPLDLLLFFDLGANALTEDPGDSDEDLEDTEGE